MKQIIIFILVSIVIATTGCMEYTPSTTVEPEPMPTPIWTPAWIVASAPVAPTPVPTVISTPKRYIPDHAYGNKKQCGTCHTYPSFDEDNTPYRTSPTPPRPTPTPQKTKQYTPPLYIIPSNNAPIPSDYYSQDCELPTDQSMQEYLANSEWVDDYDAGGWDCSQMAAYMEFMLENCGYHTVIRDADMEGEQYGHAWILVEFRQGWLAYECTGRYWVYPDEATARSYDPYGTVHWNPSKYDAGMQYESIYDIWDDYKQYSNGEEVFLKEYGWWTN